MRRSGPNVLVTGGAGFIGSNLADRLAADGCQVTVLDALARPGVERNLAWLQQRHGAGIRPVIGDVREAAPVAEAAREADVVFHLAAQVAVTTSMADPMGDFRTNILGTLNVLEAVRAADRGAPVIFASTNKVYGNLSDVLLEARDDAYVPVDAAVRAHGVAEDRPLDFHTPYGCSKGAADQYVLDYARSFGTPTCVLRMSCVYGPRQMGTEDQGWVAHFLIRALRGDPITVYGDGRQVRDVLHVRDAAAAYVAAWARIDAAKGKAFNLGGGPKNAVSLRQMLRAIEQIVGRSCRTTFSGWRAGDQRYYVSNPSAVRAALDLPEPLDWESGLRDLAGWLRADGPPAARARLAAV